MRIISTVSVFILCLSLLGCTSGAEINGRSVKAANRSVNRIKNRLPEDKRIEFEVSFWTIRDAFRDNGDFLSEVGGQTPDTLIEKGRDIFLQRKRDGFEKYKQYTNWDQMIAAFTGERIEQSRRKPRQVEKKGNPSVMYKL
ncbi:MAG: hypothetical protein KAG19_06090 [Methylococcales bacterium]|nr:hypothetical protein [Methylococcales bacterium]